MNDSDWRLSGQEKYLKGIAFELKTWCSYKPGWDHDHCEFCYDKISSLDDCIHEAYVSADNKYWICKKCYEDFRELLLQTV